MKKSKRMVRRKILHCLFLHLSEKYATPEFNFKADITLYELDAMLAFKSDLRIEELRSALDRLEEGTYGSCILCKKPIASEALEEDPARRYCGNCVKAYMSVTPAEFATMHQ